MDQELLKYILVGSFFLQILQTSEAGYLEQTAGGIRDQPVPVSSLGLHYTCRGYAVASHVIHPQHIISRLENNQITYKALHPLLSTLNAGNSFQCLNKSPFLASFQYHNLSVAQYAVPRATYRLHVILSSVLQVLFLYFQSQVLIYLHE